MREIIGNIYMLSFTSVFGLCLIVCVANEIKVTFQ